MTKSKQKSLLAKKLLDLSYLISERNTGRIIVSVTASTTATRTFTATTAQLLDLSYLIGTYPRLPDLSYLNLNRSRRRTFEGTYSRTTSGSVTRTFIASTAQSNRVSNMNSKEKEKFKNFIKISKIIRKRLEFSKSASNICEINNKNKCRSLNKQTHLSFSVSYPPTTRKPRTILLGPTYLIFKRTTGGTIIATRTFTATASATSTFTASATATRMFIASTTTQSKFLISSHPSSVCLK